MRFSSLSALFAAAAVTAGAQAATLSWVPVEISAFNQPAVPAGAVSYDLIIDLAPNEDWQATDLFLSVEGGVVFQSAAGGNVEPNPAVIDFVPGLAVDTYAASPSGDASIAGGFTGVLGSNTGSPIITPTTYGVAAFDSVAAFGVDGQLARITFTGTPTISSFVSVLPQGGSTVVIPVPQIPEPTSLAMLGLGGLALVRRRK